MCTNGICGNVLITSLHQHLIDTWSTLDQHLSWHSIEIWSKFWSRVGRESADFCRHRINVNRLNYVYMRQFSLSWLSTDCQSSLDQMLIECWLSTMYFQGWLRVSIDSLVHMIPICYYFSKWCMAKPLPIYNGTSI